MRARDDARHRDATRLPDLRGSRASRPHRPPPARHVLLVTLLLGALPGAALTGLLAERVAPDRMSRYVARTAWRGAAPDPAEWPRAPRAGESAVVAAAPGGPVLEVSSHTAAGAEQLARELQRTRLSGIGAMHARRAALRDAWARALSPAPLPPLSAAAACAAELRARALAGRGVAGPAVDPAGRGVRVEVPAAALRAADPARLEAADANVERLARAAAPDSLARALTAASLEERLWLTALAHALPGDARDALESAWSAREHRRATALDGLAAELEAALAPRERAPVTLAAAEHAFELEREVPDPAAVLYAAAPWDGPEPAHPATGTWVALLAAGALAGALVVSPVAARVARRLRRSRPRREVPVPGRVATAADRASTSWLHVVSGPGPEAIARAVGDLGALFLARGERVLVVDGGRRLRLHQLNGGDERWGLVECLEGGMPLLGALQSGGHPGLFVLAHGAPARAERWERLGALLADARPHFTRVVLALDALAPRAVGEALAGRLLEGWWSERGPALPRSAQALSERLGIALSCMDLPSEVEPLLEASARAAAAPPALPAGEPEAAAFEAVLRTAGDGEPAPASAAAPPAGPPVVASDPQVRERLRFLLWLRRVRAEDRGEAEAPVPQP